MTRDLSRFQRRAFDRGASKLREACWVLIRSLLFLPAVPWPSALRVFWLRRFGARIGKGTVIRARVQIAFPWRLELGDHVWIGEEVRILNLAPVRIESNVCISQRAFLCTGSHDYRREDFALVVKPITLRAGCWVAAQSFIGPGIEIGANSVVGAASAVFRDVAPHSLVQGHPAKLVRSLDA